ncbi:MAG: hypothetical protein ACRDZO_04690 [Egibacteraceae bacterium]
MLYSAEARWFFKGAIPKAVDDWFLDGNRVEPEVRVDRYLVFPGCDSVGVKLRDADGSQGGEFEIKALVGASQVTRFTRDVTARTDAWVKWTCPAQAFLQGPRAMRSAESSWVTVTKQRSLRRFSLDGDVCVEVEADQHPDGGCDAELTALEVNRTPWWTFGFESSGPREAVRSHLLAVASRWLDRGSPCDLGVIQSASYPTWVAGIAA